MSITPQGAQRVDVRTFDPHTATSDEWAAYQGFRRRRADEEVFGEPQFSDADFERNLRQEWPFARYLRFAAWEGRKVIGNLMIEYRREGTPDYERFAPFIGVGGGVLTDSRRKGIASALMPHLRDFMATHDKHTATFARVVDPAGHAFLQAIGAAHKHRVIENRLAFAGLHWNELARWETGAIERHPALRWERHVGRVATTRLAPLMAPLTALINTQPLGELDAPPLRYELDGYATWYADMDRRGGDHFMMLLMDGDEVAAVCDASWDARFADRLYQQLTAVAPAWRGRGLAKAVKAAMLRAVHARHPEVTMAITNNANVNAPMLSINERLGFALHRQESVYQIGRDALDAVVNARSL